MAWVGRGEPEERRRPPGPPISRLDQRCRYLPWSETYQAAENSTYHPHIDTLSFFFEGAILSVSGLPLLGSSTQSSDIQIKGPIFPGSSISFGFGKQSTIFHFYLRHKKGRAMPDPASAYLSKGMVY